MHLIVAEKNISARRIAEILGHGKKIIENKDAGVSTYAFGDTTTVGLRGHVVEIDFVEGYGNWRSEKYTPRSLIDAKTIKIPTERKIVSLLQKLAKKAERVTIATDFDTEGELIGKEAYELVRAVNPKVIVDRARFSAITSQELTHAFSHTTELDFALAAAGEARQSIDLMWGAALTRFISLAARRGGQNILSVGRVQSPTLAMIVDREKENVFCKSSGLKRKVASIFPVPIKYIVPFNSETSPAFSNTESFVIPVHVMFALSKKMEPGTFPVCSS